MKTLLVLVGPTASGKTALAEALAEDFPLVLVSADSQQVYRGLDIGTSKPGPGSRGRWSLLDVADLGSPFSAGDFCRLASSACASAWAAGRTPLLCGGTGLYLKALLRGLADLPRPDPGLRAGLERAWRRDGLDALLSRLDVVDPELAARVDRSNPRRVLRALEVYEATGRPLSAWQAETTRPALCPDRALWLGLDPGRDELERRIAARTDEALRSGWLEEVESLARRHGDGALSACPAIGYPELLDHARGRVPLEAARAAIVERTRRYARRQRTWFRAQGGIHWLAPDEPAGRAVRSLLGSP